MNNLEKKNLGEKWKDFFSTLLSPWFLFTGIVTIVIIMLSMLFKEDENFSNLLIVLGGVMGGVTGGCFSG